MIPRIFVSSTYYDLKHVRERLENFIENYGFEPILFESDKVTYQHNKEIDQSAYFEVGLCHLMVLIVGGRYGSPSSQTNFEDDRKKYDDDYISITRKEFETAIGKNIPILIFIDKNVYAEYQTYKENQDFFDEIYKSKTKQANSTKFKFAHVDHVNIFKFVDIIRTKPVKTFEKIDEIENYIKSQLSGMFYLYLESLKKKSEDNKILDTITELNNVTLRMNEMINSVGKEILGEDKQKYENVIESQFLILIDFFIEKLSTSLEFEFYLSDEELQIIDLNIVTDLFFSEVFEINISKSNSKNWNERNLFNVAMDRKILTDFQDKLFQISTKLEIRKFHFRKINEDFKEKVLPFIKNEIDILVLKERVKILMKDKLQELPF